MEIIHKNGLTPVESERLFHWREHVFDPVDPGIEFSHLAHHYLAVDDGRVAAHAACDLKRIRQHEVEIPVVGIGSVVVHPEYQGRKLAQTVLRHIHGRMESEHPADIAWLFCMPSMEKYYVTCGYRTIMAPVRYEQSTGLVGCPWVSMAYEKTGALVKNEGVITILSTPW